MSNYLEIENNTLIDISSFRTISKYDNESHNKLQHCILLRPTNAQIISTRHGSNYMDDMRCYNSKEDRDTIFNKIQKHCTMLP